MEKLYKIKIVPLLIFLISVLGVSAQDTEKPELMMNIRYFSQNNNFQYLKVRAQVKANNKIEPVAAMVIKLYLDEVADENVIGTVKTDIKGDAKAIIPAALKQKWSDTTVHKFIAVSPATKLLEESSVELEVAKAKIVIDTLNGDGVRQVTAQVLAYENGEWTPANEVELKLGVRRSGADLNIGEEETYTTDSTGQVVGEFKLDSLPSDPKGNIILVAKMEDNDLYGNLAVEKTVPLGAYIKHESTFQQRSLWGTGDKAPVWLIGMAFLIVAIVWGAIIYLVYQIVRLRKLGRSQDKSEEDKEPEPIPDLVEEFDLVK